MMTRVLVLVVVLVLHLAVVAGLQCYRCNSYNARQLFSAPEHAGLVVLMNLIFEGDFLSTRVCKSDFPSMRNDADYTMQCHGSCVRSLDVRGGETYNCLRTKTPTGSGHTYSNGAWESSYYSCEGDFCNDNTDACKPSRCLNDGECSKDGVSGFTCRCKPGYSGDRCQTVGSSLFNVTCTGRYYLGHVKMNREASVKFCKSLGGQLATVENQTEQNNLVAIAKRHSKDEFFWIGANDIKNEGRWVNVDDKALTYTAWGAGEPNSFLGLNEDCAALSKPWHGYKWVDAPCEAEYIPICEVGFSAFSKDALCISGGSRNLPATTSLQLIAMVYMIISTLHAMRLI